MLRSLLPQPSAARLCVRHRPGLQGPAARLCAQAAAPWAPDPAVQEQWASIHAFFESTHFGSVQYARGEELEDLLRQRFRVEKPSRQADLELRPLDAQVDPNKRVDPVDLMYRWARNSEDTTIPQDALLELLASAHELLLEEVGPLLDLRVPERGKDPKLVIVGDTHGQLLDVLHIFHTQGPPSEACMYLFNGDVADRGPQAVEIMILILAFKLRFPRHVHFLRGNHENREINERPKDLGGGFLEECLEKYGEQVYTMFEGIFRRLPLFAVVQDEIFVVHGGLFRTPNVTLDTLRRLSNWQQHYPMFNGRHDTPVSSWSADQAILFDAQWGDPHPMQGMRPSRRGPGVMDFGRDVTEDFLERNGLSLCIRSHECPRSGRGFAFAHGQRVLTVFSASNYCGVMGNRGAVAVLRPRASAVLAVTASEEPRLFAGVSLQVIEHDISVESPESGSDVFRQASVARRVARECHLLQPALSILLFNREVLRARCQEADPDSTGNVAKAFLLRELAAICGNIDWERVLGDCLCLGPDIAYSSFLDAIRVRWLYSTAEQAARLADVMLNGELPFQDLSSLFGINKVPDEGGERCAVTGLRRAAKLISPDITQWQLEDLVSVLGGTAGERPEDFVGRLLLFAPAMPEPQEAWMRGVPSRLGRLLRRWADTPDGFSACCRFYSAHAGDAYGVLSNEAVAKAFEDVLVSAAPADLDGLVELFAGGSAGVERRVDASRLGALVQAIDTNCTGTVSFLEFARALAPAWEPATDWPPVLLEMVAVHTQRNTGVEEFVFSYRGALLRGCRFVDTHGSGLLEPEVFVEVADALAQVVGRPLTPRQVERLRAVLGRRLVPYALALSRFERVLDKQTDAVVA
uniref:Serine/threonine-protein phosphatase n=1 Tax=Alexandrium monilatum TaxID=311494 RepID=A0A7S4QPF2_9DINO